MGAGRGRARLDRAGVERERAAGQREQPVERLWRELRVDRIWEGTSEIQRLVIANEIDKRGLDGLLAFPAAVSAVPA